MALLRQLSADQPQVAAALDVLAGGAPVPPVAPQQWTHPVAPQHPLMQAMPPHAAMQLTMPAAGHPAALAQWAAAFTQPQMQVAIVPAAAAHQLPQPLPMSQPSQAVPSVPPTPPFDAGSKNSAEPSAQAGRAGASRGGRRGGGPGSRGKGRAKGKGGHAAASATESPAPDADAASASATAQPPVPPAAETAAPETSTENGRGRGGRAGRGARAGRGVARIAVETAKRKQRVVGDELPPPPRPASAFAFFADSRGPQLIAENPGLEARTIERERLLIAQWRELSDEDRAPFEEEAARDRERYEAALAARRAAKEAAAQAPAGPPAKRARGQKRGAAAVDAPPVGDATASKEVRPPASAFVFFSQTRRPELLASQPELDGHPIKQEQLLVREWRELPEASRAAFEEQAARDLERYELEVAGGHGGAGEHEEEEMVD